MNSICAAILITIFITPPVLGHIYMFLDTSSYSTMASICAELCKIIAVMADCYIFYTLFKKIRISFFKGKVTRKYGLPPSNNIEQSTFSLNINHSYINKEVLYTVNSYKDSNNKINLKYSAISNESQKILSFEGCTSINEMQTYLDANEERLRQLKEEGDSCLNQLSLHKIEMLNEDATLLTELRDAFSKLRKSERCFSSEIRIDNFVTLARPRDLSFFKFENDPIILYFMEFYLCLFSNVILIFDDAGIFYTAVDPTALTITVRRSTCNVRVGYDGTSERDIARDMRLISRGRTQYTWRHTRQDGNPDRRYKDNPRLEYRFDIYEAVIVDLLIAGTRITFSATSSDAGDSLERVASKYLQECPHRHTPIPALLQLMKNLEDDPQIDSLIQMCSRTNQLNYFCKITTS